MKTNQSEKVLVTGGAGFIGSHLIGKLLNENRQVICLDDFSSGSLSNLKIYEGNSNLTICEGSIMNNDLVQRLIAQVSEVYHLAAVVGVKAVVENPLKMIEVNVRGSHNVISEAAVQQKKTFIASSSEIYGKSAEDFQTESSDTVLGSSTHLRWSYACAKQMDEFLGLALGKKKNAQIVVGRFFNTVGPRQNSTYGMVIPKFVQQALRNEPLTVYDDGNQVRCFGHVDDVSRMVVDLMKTPAAIGQVINIGTSEATSIRQLAELVISKSSSRSKLTFIPSAEVYGKDFEEPKRRIPNLSKVDGLLGVIPRKKLVDIVDDVIRFERSRLS